MEIHLALVIALGACLVQVNTAAYVRAVGAASFNHGKEGLLIYTANNFYIIAMDNSETNKKYDLSTLGLPADLNLTAVVATYQHLDKRIFYGETYGYLKSWSGDLKEGSFKYGKKRLFLMENGGPDAAVRRKGEMYLFRGCEYVIRYRWNVWSDANNMTTAGLPCDLDAAWKDVNNKSSALLRGDDVWFWDEANGDVTGPYKFGHLFPSFTADTIAPYGEVA